MTNKHMNAKRIAHRTREELNATRRIAVDTSWPDALNTLHAKLDIQVMNRNGYQESPAVKARLLRKHETVLNYLEDRFGDYCASYDYSAAIPNADPALEDKIWVCWWQGLENAPEIVKACVESVKHNACGREVIVVTNENIDEYVQLPGWVMEKYGAGILSKTHLSDLLRLCLLARYGGLWLDATFFCTGPLAGSVYNAPLFSIRRPDYLHASVACGQFANYSFGCDTGHRRIFVTLRDFLLDYWSHEDFLVDYLLTDYLVVLARRHDPYIDDSFDAIEPNNPMCDELFKCLGDPVDEDKWAALRYDTNLFKLTWKQSFPRKKNGRRTFYDALLEGDLQ